MPDMISASQLAAIVDGGLRFDKVIESFEFKPSIGISAKRMMSLSEALQDMKEPLELSVTTVMTLSILENFMSGGRPKWEELSQVTIQRRQKNGSGDMILVRSGALADAASSKDIWSIGKTTAAVRSLPNNVWYGYVHQAGYEGGGGGKGAWFKKYQNAARRTLGTEASQREVDGLASKIFDQRQAKHGPAPREASPIPARPFILFQDEDIDAIELVFSAWVESKIREAGFR